MTPNRSADTIKQDMLEWAKENIYARIGEEWDYHGRDFDPLVHLLVGACASELKNMYDAIDGADRRIVKKLAQLLLPEQAHLPAPARALAAAVPTASTAQLSETLQLRCDTDAGPFYFTPAFNCTILNSTLKVVGSDGLIFEYRPEQGRLTDQHTYVSKILLGFEAPKPIASFDNALFYFNLLGDNNQILFLHALFEGQWKINGQPVEKSRGFRKENELFAHQGELGAQTMRRVEEVYRPYFFTTHEYPSHVLFKRNISEVVISWLRENHTDTPSLEQQAHALPLVEDNFFWIEIQLPFPVRVFEFEKNFRCATNIFPVVNRRLHVKDDADTFLNRPVVDVVSITPDKPFAGVYQVENLQNKEVLQTLPFNQLKGCRGPAYSVRYGGVGRTDNYSTWSRFAYLLGLFREEHRYREVMERIGSKLSIEELHLLIGEKIQKDEPPTVAENSIYFFLHPGESLKGGIRARISYWTTEGAKANRIPAGKSLACEPPDPSLRKEGFTLITVPAGGKDAPEEMEYYQQIRNNLQPQERIVTAEDVRRFCSQHVGEPLRQVTLEPGVQVDPRPDGGISRVLNVLLRVDQPDSPAWTDTCRELEYLLNQKANGIIPYVVRLKDPDHA